MSAKAMYCPNCSRAGKVTVDWSSLVATCEECGASCAEEYFQAWNECFEAKPVRKPKKGYPATSAYLKRRAAVERKVLAQVRDERGFSIFWATESMERARAIQRLERAGAIRALKGRRAGNYPWCGYEMAEGGK